MTATTKAKLKRFALTFRFSLPIRKDFEVEVEIPEYADDSEITEAAIALAGHRGISFGIYAYNPIPVTIKQIG